MYLFAFGQFGAFECRDAGSSYATSISNGWVVGWYYDANWSLHSFLTPIAPLTMHLTLNAFLPYDNIPDPHPYFGHNRVFEGDGDTRTWVFGPQY